MTRGDGTGQHVHAGRMSSHSPAGTTRHPLAGSSSRDYRPPGMDSGRAAFLRDRAGPHRRRQGTPAVSLWFRKGCPGLGKFRCRNGNRLIPNAHPSENPVPVGFGGVRHGNTGNAARDGNVAGRLVFLCLVTGRFGPAVRRPPGQGARDRSDPARETTASRRPAESACRPADLPTHDRPDRLYRDGRPRRPATQRVARC